LRKSPSNDQSGSEPVRRIEVTQTNEEILEYWTEQRMAEAKPRDITLPANNPRLKQGAAETDKPGSGTTDAEP
jgi:hypothetical protein